MGHRHNHRIEDKTTIYTTAHKMLSWYLTLAGILIFILIVLVGLFEIRSLELIIGLSLLCFAPFIRKLLVSPNAFEGLVMNNRLTGQKSGTVEKMVPKLLWEDVTDKINMKAEIHPDIPAQEFSTQKGNVKGKPTIRLKADVGKPTDSELERTTKMVNFASNEEEANIAMVRATSLKGMRELLSKKKSADKAIAVTEDDFDKALKKHYDDIEKDLSVLILESSLEDLDYGEDVVKTKASQFKAQAVTEMVNAMIAGGFTPEEAKRNVMSIMEGVRYSEENKNYNFSVTGLEIPKMSPELAKAFAPILKGTIDFLNKLNKKS